jgi:hypothetical protein
MVFFLRSLKLYGESAETPKVSEVPENFTKIPKIFEKREMLTLSGYSEDFCGVYGSVLNLTASFFSGFYRFFGDSGLNSLIATFRGLVFIPLTPPICCCWFLVRKIHIHTLRSSLHSRFAKDKFEKRSELG